ncbi:MAG: double zinc ribbon domain-containing protein [Lachnospiraceae bacterium]|nr:double zinc ribbon domain-containing protein [Lachnospiraceae bacterium]
MSGEIANIIYPPRCPGCDAPLRHGESLCADCRGSLRPRTGSSCMKCGKTIRSEEGLYCYDCSRKVHNYDRGYCIFEYEDVRESLYRFKYMGRSEYASYYAKVAYDAFGRVFKECGADALIPVPIHEKRRKKRGYNQAEELAKELSKLCGIPVMEDVCIRSKSTVPLKNLNESERINNLKKAFIIARNDVKLKTIIIIDDIYTTGSTIDAISALFRTIGVENIYFLAVAIGRGL